MTTYHVHNITTNWRYPYPHSTAAAAWKHITYLESLRNRAGIDMVYKIVAVDDRELDDDAAFESDSEARADNLEADEIYTQHFNDGGLRGR